MKPLLYTGAGFMLALLFVYCLTVAYDRGMMQVVSDCKFYGKHATDGTEVIYCSLDPEPFTIKVIDTKVGKKK